MICFFALYVLGKSFAIFQTIFLFWQKGANSNAKDDLGRTPDQCIPQKPPSKREREKAKLMQELL